MKKLFKQFSIAIALVLTVQHSLWGAEQERKKIGLALSGGGARGAAHVGVLRVLEQLRIPVDYIAGTSMGSVVGGLYASGMTPDEIEQAMLAIDWAHVFEDEPARVDRSFRRKRDDDFYLIKAKPGYNDGEFTLPTGLVQGQKFALILRELTLPVSKINDFDQLSIPFRAVATDIGTGEEVVLGSGDLALSMRASMTVPGAFAAVSVGGHLLVDGGITNNLPINRVREMGADIVIAVDISTPMAPPEQVNNVIKITGQLISIMTRSNTEIQLASLKESDVLIVPDLGDITTADFKRVADAFPRGTEAAQAARNNLLPLALTPGKYQQYLAKRKQRDTIRPVIDFVRVDNRSRVDDGMIRERIHIPLGEPLNVTALEADLQQIYGLELFEGVSYEIVEEDERNGVIVHAKERSWGPNYLQFGLTLSGNFEGDNQFNIGAAYQKTAMNSLGGEMRTGIQIGQEPAFVAGLHQPLDYTSHYFIAPLIEYRKENITLFSSGDKIAEYRVGRLSAELGLGREFGAWGEFRLGVRGSTGDAEVLVGDPNLPDIDFDTGDFFTRLSLDKFDNVNFPRTGYFGEIEGSLSRTELGADSSYDQVKVDFLTAFPWGRHTTLLGLNVGATLNGDASIADRFRLGGFTRLSGFENNEISGQQYLTAKAIYYKRFGEIRLLPLYLGGSLEAGNVWEKKDDISIEELRASGSLFFGLDSPVGPVYIGAGYTEGGNSAYFMTLGRNF